MKKPLLWMLLLCLTTNSFGQFQLHPDSSFYNFIDTFYSYLQDDGSEGGLYNKMKRDRMSWGVRLFPSGQMSVATQAITSYAKDYSSPFVPQPLSNLSVSVVNNAEWTELGPLNNSTGIGQIHRIAFHPQYNGTTNQIVYAGSHYGGLFRSDDGGQNWTNWFTDRGLPVTSVAGIAVTNNSLFVCTGNGDFGYDKFGYNANYSTLGPGSLNNYNPVHTQGVYKYNPTHPKKWVPINGIGANSVTMIGGGTKADLQDVFAEGGTMRNIIVHPTNDAIIFIATSLGIFRTTDGGNTWAQVLNFTNATDWRGIEFHPTDPSIVYASGRSIFESTDGGSSWSILADANNLPSQFPSSVAPERINLAVTPADPNLLYAYSVGRNSISGVRSGTVILYDRQQATWTLLNTNLTSSIYNSYQASWTGIAVSPVNPEFVYTTNTKVWGSKTAISGGGWKYQSPYNNSQFHADVHDVVFPPSSDDFLFAATHGGVNRKSTINNNTGGWVPLYSGLGVGNIWAFDDWEGNPDIIVSAHQCTGTLVSTNRGQTWGQRYGGDGYGARIDDQSGLAFIKGNSVSDFRRLEPTGSGVTNESQFLPPLLYGSGGERIQNAFAMLNHPKTDEMYFGMNGLHKRLITEPTGGTSSNSVWERISDMNFYPQQQNDWNRRVMDIAISEDENTNITYISTLGDLSIGRRTDFYVAENNTATICNPAPCFDKRTANLPVTSMPPAGNANPNPTTGIAIDPLNGNRVWTSASGFDPNIKVLYSDDRGMNWVSYDDNDNTLANLNMPINHIVYQRGTQDRLYIATDVGVYVRENGGNWTRLGEDFPNVRVVELKINYCLGKLRVATFGRGTWETDLLPPEDDISYRSFRVISGNDVWTDNKNMVRDIRIKTGAKLELKNITLNMPKNGMIIIEPGGQLLVNGSTITNLCGETWEGISVWGQTDKPQNFADQGAAVFNDSKVEFAKNALRSWEVGNFPNAQGTTGGTGGIIRATNTEFVNNWRSVELMKYEAPPLIFTGSPREGSFFKECLFTVDDNFRPFDGETAPIFLGHISMWATGGTQIKGCTFKDERSNKVGGEGGSYGIATLGASPHISSQPVGATYPPSSYIRNTFEGLERSIEIGNFPETNFNSVVDQSDFLDNKRSVIIQSHNGAKIIRNTFNIGGFQSNDSEYGVSLLNSSNFEVEQNVFNNSPNSLTGEVGLGVWIDNTGSNYHRIQNNDFNDLALGNLAHGFNGEDVFNPSGGTQYLCNNLVNNALDFTLIKASGSPIGASLADNQGASNFPARNTFSIPLSPIFGIDWHFNNDASVQSIINYHTQTTINAEMPTDIFNVNLLNIVSNSGYTCQDNYFNPSNPNIQESDGEMLSLVKLKKSYYKASSEYELLKEEYQSTLDKGNTGVLVTEIKNTQSQDKGELKDDLLSISPFLSKEALLETAECGLYTNVELREIIEANPNVICDDDFMCRLKDSCTTPLDSSDIDTIIASIAVTMQPNRREFERTALLSEIGKKGQDLTKWANEVIFFYGNDSTGPDNDSIEVWIRNKPGVTAAYELVEHYWRQSRYLDALELVTDIPAQYDLDGIILENHFAYEQLKNMLYQAYQDGRTEANLEQNEVGELRDIASLNYGFASVQAANIVNFFYGYAYYYDPTIPNLFEDSKGVFRSSGSNTEHESTEENLQNNSKVWGYPNPANTWIDLAYELPDSEMKGEIKMVISNTVGKVIQEKTLTSSEGLVSLNTREWTPGIYFAVVFYNKNKSNVYKFVVRK